MNDDDFRTSLSLVDRVAYAIWDELRGRRQGLTPAAYIDAAVRVIAVVYE